MIHGTLENIKKGMSPDKAFAEACENENLYGMRADIVEDRRREANILRSKHRINIDLNKVNSMIG